MTAAVRIAAFRLADRLARRGLKGLAACHQGLWLGLLDAAALDRVTAGYYDAAARYRSVEHNLSGLLPWERLALERHFAGCRSLVVGAAGGGRELLALARRGLRVRGFECSPALVARCRELLAEAGLEAAIDLAPPADLPPGLGRFDGALLGWGAYMHVPGRARRIAFLGKLHRHLAPGGPLLLSFLTRPETSRFHAWVAALGNGVRPLRLCRERVEPGDTLAGTFDHHFTRDEIRSELAAAGYELVAFAEQPYGHAVGRARDAGESGCAGASA